MYLDNSKDYREDAKAPSLCLVSGRYLIKTMDVILGVNFLLLEN